MVKYLDHPEPGEHSEPRNIQGEGRHSPVPEGTPTPVRPKDLRRWQQTFAPVHLDAPKRRTLNGDARRRTSDDLYAVRLSGNSEAAEPRSDASAEHCAPETPSDAVPDDAPLNGQ